VPSPVPGMELSLTDKLQECPISMLLKDQLLVQSYVSVSTCLSKNEALCLCISPSAVGSRALIHCPHCHAGGGSTGYLAGLEDRPGVGPGPAPPLSHT
jgi:hypothetical protein